MILLTLYTVNKKIDLIEYKRRRFNKSSINVTITYQSFKKKVQKILFISNFINDYNHYIKDVNLVN